MSNSIRTKDPWLGSSSPVGAVESLDQTTSICQPNLNFCGGHGIINKNSFIKYWFVLFFWRRRSTDNFRCKAKKEECKNQNTHWVYRTQDTLKVAESQLCSQLCHDSSEDFPSKTTASFLFSLLLLASLILLINPRYLRSLAAFSPTLSLNFPYTV